MVGNVLRVGERAKNRRVKQKRVVATRPMVVRDDDPNDAVGPKIVIARRNFVSTRQSTCALAAEVSGMWIATGYAFVMTSLACHCKEPFGAAAIQRTFLWATCPHSFEKHVFQAPVWHKACFLMANSDIGKDSAACFGF